MLDRGGDIRLPGLISPHYYNLGNIQPPDFSRLPVSFVLGTIFAYPLMVILRVPAVNVSTNGLILEGHGTQQSKAMGNQASCY